MHGLQKFPLVGRRSWFGKTSGGRCPSLVVPGCAFDCQNNGALDGEEMERHALVNLPTAEFMGCGVGVVGLGLALAVGGMQP